MRAEFSPDSTARRLAKIYPFDTDILDIVNDVAERQNSQTYDQLMATVPGLKKFKPKGSKPIEVLDIIPKTGHYDMVQVIHHPMAGPLNSNRIVQAATIAAAQPNTRIIAVGNPGKISRGAGKLPLSKLRAAYGGDLRPTVDATLCYLKEQGIKTADHIGSSFGADKAVTVSIIAHKYGHRVRQLVLIDPATVRSWGVRELFFAFIKAMKAMPEYVEATGSQAYKDARSHDSMLAYTIGLLRLTNLSIAHALLKGGFKDRLMEGMKQMPKMRVSLLCGEQSELCDPELMGAISEPAQQKFGANRVSFTAVPGQKHAMNNDMYLCAAMIMQSLRGAN